MHSRRSAASSRAATARSGLHGGTRDDGRHTLTESRAGAIPLRLLTHHIPSDLLRPAPAASADEFTPLQPPVVQLARYSHLAVECAAGARTLSDDGIPRYSLLQTGQEL